MRSHFGRLLVLSMALPALILVLLQVYAGYTKQGYVPLDVQANIGKQPRWVLQIDTP